MLVENRLLTISETKIDESFPKSQFLIKGFSNPFRIVNRNVHGGGILLYVREDFQKNRDREIFKYALVYL